MLAPGSISVEVKHSGAVMRPLLRTSVAGGRGLPAPKFSTSVKVWVRPPLFLTLTDSPTSILRYGGSFYQA